MAKLYNSRDWLFHMIKVKGLTTQEVAKIAKCSHQTIYLKLKEFGLDS